MTVTRRQLAQSIAAAGLASCSRGARPNVVFFYADDLRATVLDLYNPGGVAMPNLRRLADTGTVFDHSYTPHPLCLPARVSLWTGRYSSTHGSRYNQKLMAEGTPNAAESFRNGGYEMGIFGKNHCFTAGQLERWFQSDYSIGSAKWKAAISPETARGMREIGTWRKERGGGVAPPSAAPFSHELFPTHIASQHAVDFISKQDGERPFFAWVSLVDPHTPTDVPEKFAGALPPEPAKLPAYRDKTMAARNARMRIYEYLIRGREIPDEYLASYLRIYCGKTAFLDFELGRILDTLEARGLRDNTIVVFASDNGDFAGEHHLMVKTGCLLDSMVRMPLVISWPGGAHAKGKRENAFVNHVDLLPWLLSECGLPALTGVQSRPLPVTPDAPRRDFVYAEYGNGDPDYTWEEARKVGPAKRLGDYALATPLELAHLERRERAGHLRMIRTHGHKLIADSNGDIEFYDLGRDPGELENVHGQSAYAAEEARLRRILDARPGSPEAM